MQRNFFFLFFLLFFILFYFAESLNIVGLQNYGETCYANSVFQLLYRNEDFRRSLDKYLLTNQNPKLQSLQELFDKMNSAATGSTVSPATFEALPDNFSPGVQYDVAEVLAKFQGFPHFDWSPFAIKVEDIHSQASNIFAVEFDLELLLDVPQTEPVCLHDLLTLHFSHLIIQSISKNLIVRIKRLRNVNGFEQKIFKNISIPENISLQKFCNPSTIPATSTKFQLGSFIEHCGKCSYQGHYLFFFHNRETDDYYCINDENIQKISKEKFLERASKAYLFLYRQIEQ